MHQIDRNARSHSTQCCYTAFRRGVQCSDNTDVSHSERAFHSFARRSSRLYSVRMLKGSVTMFTCPVCYFTGMQDPPMDYNICECCGTEFGNDDEIHSHEELRSKWIADGAKWFFGSAPIGWNPWKQLFEANVSLTGPPYNTAFSPYGSPSSEFKMTSSITGPFPYGAASIRYESPDLATRITFMSLGLRPYGAASPVHYGGLVSSTEMGSATTTDVLASAA
jgi:hypothetical protein